MFDDFDDEAARRTEYAAASAAASAGQAEQMRGRTSSTELGRRASVRTVGRSHWPRQFDEVLKSRRRAWPRARHGNHLQIVDLGTADRRCSASTPTGEGARRSRPSPPARRQRTADAGPAGFAWRSAPVAVGQRNVIQTPRRKALSLAGVAGGRPRDQDRCSPGRHFNPVVAGLAGGPDVQGGCRRACSTKGRACCLAQFGDQAL